MLTEYVTLNADGRLILPARLRRSIGVKPGDTLVVESDGDSLLVRPHAAVLHDVQTAFAPYRVDGRSAVDELIADRRAEADREAAEPE